MNENSSKFGSIWRKWDLHFHTPSSFDYADKSVTNQQLVDVLIASGIEVVAITDHNIIDVARIKELQALAGNRLTVLPGIEFRSELGGSDSVHFIGIFPEDCPIDDVWTKLSGKLEITPTDVVRKGGEHCIYCDLADTAAIVCDLGGLISVHAGSKSNSLEGIKSANLINQKMKLQLVRECIDIFEVGAAKDITMYREKIFPHFDYPVPLIACSDNHDIKSYPSDGFFWLKGDRCFESLRQALYEPENRVQVGDTRPLEPLLRMDTVVLDFPMDSVLKSNGVTNPFCFRGKQEISFSPFLTCLVGGRGSGKSTILNLLHEKMYPGKNRFFSDKSIVASGALKIDEAVSVDGDHERMEIEFLHQNEIEQFALDPSRFTTAVFSRLAKLDSGDELLAIESKIKSAVDLLDENAKSISEYFELRSQIQRDKQELQTNKRLVDSFQNENYKALRDALGTVTRESQRIKSGRTRLQEFASGIRSVVSKFPIKEEAGADSSAHEIALSSAKTKIESALQEAETEPGVVAADAELVKLEEAAEEIKGRLEGFLRERGLSPENLADVGRASERIARLEQKIPVAETRLGVLTQGIRDFQFQGDLRDQYYDSVSKLLNPINESLAKQGDQVRPIRLEYEYDETAAREFLEAKLSRYVVNEDDRKIRADHLSRALEDVDFFKFPRKVELHNAIKAETKTGQAVLDYFEEDENFHKFVQDVRSVILSVDKFRRIKLFYDERPIESASFGQRCTAAIVVLILLGNTPIIIDEPEAHLDSSLIAKYLVHLVKSKKVERQIIFATHNANFVINGDAELIHMLKADGNAPSTLISMTIENLDHRESLLALEGGAAAFLQRENRYGIN